MRKQKRAGILFFILIAGLLVLMPNKIFAETEYVSGEVLVKFVDGTSFEAVSKVLSTYQLTVQSTVGNLAVYQVQTGDATVMEMISELSGNPAIEYAEPNYIRRVSRTVNDTLFANQWGLSNTGQTLTCGFCYGDSVGINGNDINAIAGWDTQIGSESVIIAIIDTGVDLDHPDLDGKIVAGYDYVNNDSTPDDDHGHGTHVAGIAAAETNNGIGVAGVCWACKIMPVKVMDNTGSGSDSDIASGIAFAVNNKGDSRMIINLSLGASAASNTLEAAIKSAHSNGVLSVCASGNLNTAVSYPAANDTYCLAVGATTNKDVRASFSNFGPEIDVAAPGVDIYSTYLVGGSAMDASTCKEDASNPGYGYCTGTSMSAPFVAGLAGIILSQNPSYSVDQVAFRIMQTAEDVNATSNTGFDNQIGAGRVMVTPTAIETTNIAADDDSGLCFFSTIGKLVN